jgi:hypothetical protein
MRQHLNDEKIHYKLYKDGKNWVAASIVTGIAIPVALFSAAFLSPVHGVQATSNDPGYSYTAGSSDAVNQQVADGIKAGTVYDATPKGNTSGVVINEQQVQALADAHMQLTLNGNNWTISPDSNYSKIDLDTVLSGLGYPTAAVNDPTSKVNAQAIIDYLKDGNLQSVNSGTTTREDGNISWMHTPLISGSSVDMSGDQGGTVNATDKLIGNTGFGAIISGSLKLEGINSAPFPTTNAKILLANHGYLQGTNVIPWGVTNQISQFAFADGSFADAMAKLQTATKQLMGVYSAVDGSDAVEIGQDSSDNVNLDLSKAARDANGDYVFTIDADKLNDKSYDYTFTNENAYTGGNVVVNFTGSNKINFYKQGTPQASFLTGDSKLVLSVPNGNSINLTDVDGDTNGVPQVQAAVLAPTSDVITNVGEYGGIVGAINGDGSNNGYDEHTDPGNPINTNPKTPDTTVQQPKQDTKTITKTIHFVDGDGYAIAGQADKTFSTQVSADINSDGTVSKKTTATIPGLTTFPTIAGYKFDHAETEATSPTTVTYGDADLNVNVFYTKAPKYTRTIHFTDNAGNSLNVPDQVIDGVKSASLGYEFNVPSDLKLPTIKGYTPTSAVNDKSPNVKTTLSTPYHSVGGVSMNEEFTIRYTKDRVPVTVTRNVTSKYADGTKGDLSKLPKESTLSKPLYLDENGQLHTEKTGGSIVLGDPFGQFTAKDIQPLASQTIDGTTYNYAGELGDEGLDENAITEGIKQAAEAGTSYDYNISVVYYPSSTSKHKQVSFNNEVFFDYADNDYDSDPDNLPEDFTRTAVVSYVEITDSQGHSSYSDWKVEQSLDALTDANVPTMAGYRTNIENDISDEAIVGMLKSMGPITGGSVTAETQVVYQKVGLGIPQAVRTGVPADVPHISVNDHRLSKLH